MKIEHYHKGVPWAEIAMCEILKPDLVRTSVGIVSKENCLSLSGLLFDERSLFMSKNRLLMLSEIAILAAIALILDRIPLYTMPQGGSISLVMLPILLIALRNGVGAGLICGGLVGTIQLFFGGYFLNVFQVFLDYALAYAGVGLAGLVAPSFWKATTTANKAVYLTLATVIGALCRFLGNFLSGIIFYGAYATPGMPVWLYSLEYNAAYIVPSAIISGLLLFLLFKTRPDFFKK